MNIFVPATSANLGPGFDTLGLSLKLYNEVNIQPATFNSVSINGEGSDSLTLKKNNLFISIFNEVNKELLTQNKFFRIIFNNKIPFSRGLGSSSAVIISAISAAYAMSGFKVDRQMVLNKALRYESHPDNITPAVFGGFISAVVDNNCVFFNKFNIDSCLKAVVVIPDKPMNTNQSREILPKTYTKKECVNNISHSSFLTSCFASKRYDMLKIACKDMIHEERRMNTFNQLFEVRQFAYENGALMSSLSGSGSSFLNITYADEAENLRKKLSDKFSHFLVRTFDFDNDGFMITQS